MTHPLESYIMHSDDSYIMHSDDSHKYRRYLAFPFMWNDNYLTEKYNAYLLTILRI